MDELEVDKLFNDWLRTLLLNIVGLTIARNSNKNSLIDDIEDHYLLNSDDLKTLISIDNITNQSTEILLNLVKVCPITATRVSCDFATTGRMNEWAINNSYRGKRLSFSTNLEYSDERFLKMPGNFSITRLTKFKDIPTRTAITNYSILITTIAKWCGCNKILIDVSNYQTVILQLETLNKKFKPQYIINNVLFDLEN